MIQELRSVVRYSETDERGRLSLPALVNYFQDAAELQGDRLGIGCFYLQERHIAWLLSSWQIVIGRMPELGEDLVVQTWGWKFQGTFGMRNCVLLDGERNILARANGYWFLYDTQNLRPVPVPEDMIRAYGVHPRTEMHYASRKVPDFSDGTAQEPFTVGRQNLDTNHHVNNAQYVTMAQAFLPPDFTAGEMRIEYKKQAHLHDVIVPVVAERENGYAVSLRDADGEPYASALFLGEKRTE